MAISATFNGYSLQTANILTREISYDQMPDRQLSSQALIRQEASKLTFANFDKKIIKLSGRIIGTSTTDLDSRLDTLKLNLTAIEANLDIDNNGTSRRYVCTNSDANFDRISPVAANFELSFLSSVAFGTDTASTTIANAVAMTTSPKTVTTSTIGGTSPNQWVVITFTLTSFTGASSNTISFKNNATSQQISITRGYTAGDVIVVDTYNKTVTVNGTAVDYMGVFPYFTPGSAGTLIITDDFSARSASVTVTNLNRYL